MGKLNALKALRSKSKSAAAKALAQKTDALEDMIIGDMVEAMSRMGEMADDLSNWRVSKVKIVTGVEVDVLSPKAPVVEIDGMTLFDLMHKASAGVSRKVVQHFMDKLGPSFDGHSEYVQWVGHKSGHTMIDVTVRVTEMLMETQGWTLRKGAWRSPAWLFPPMNLPDIAVRSFVEAEFDEGGLLPDEQHDDDHLVNVSEGL